MVKWAASLSDKKGRDKERTFIAEGEKLSLEAIETGLPVSHIFVSEARSERILPRISAAFENSVADENCEVFILSESAFSKISTEKAPQGIISVIKYLDFFNNIDIIYKEDFFLLPSERTIALASVRDPGNLGSVIRSAVAFGVDHIVISSDSADIYNPKTVRSAMGSLFRVKVSIVSDMEAFAMAVQASGRRIYAAELSDSARSLSDIGILPSDIIVIGNEGHGIPSSLSDKCSGSVYIPISKKTESLNAAVAAAIFMWEQSK